jgi:hypothetical protein
MRCKETTKNIYKKKKNQKIREWKSKRRRRIKVYL